MDEYVSIAPYYEKFFSQFLFPLRKNICTFIHYYDHHRVIDICCGTGTQLSMLNSTDMLLVGVDNSAAMLKEARSYKKIHFHQLKAQDIDFTPQSFDAALLTFALHEKNEQERKIIFNKAWDLVRPGGHLIIGDYNRSYSSMSGNFFGNFLFPLIERVAGKQHFACYKSWMDDGALEGFLEHFTKRTDLISTHFYDSVMLCAVHKETQLNKLNTMFLTMNLLE